MKTKKTYFYQVLKKSIPLMLLAFLVSCGGAKDPQTDSRGGFFNGANPNGSIGNVQCLPVQQTMYFSMNGTQVDYANLVGGRIPNASYRTGTMVLQGSGTQVPTQNTNYTGGTSVSYSGQSGWRDQINIQGVIHASTQGTYEYQFDGTGTITLSARTLSDIQQNFGGRFCIQELGINIGVYHEQGKLYGGNLYLFRDQTSGYKIYF